METERFGLSPSVFPTQGSRRATSPPTVSRAYSYADGESARRLFEVTLQTTRVQDVSRRVVHEADEAVAIACRLVSSDVGEQFLADFVRTERLPRHLGLDHNPFRFHEIGALLRHFEQQHAIRFQRQHVAIRSNVERVEPAIRSWVLSL